MCGSLFKWEVITVYGFLDYYYCYLHLREIHINTCVWCVPLIVGTRLMVTVFSCVVFPNVIDTYVLCVRFFCCLFVINMCVIRSYCCSLVVFCVYCCMLIERDSNYCFVKVYQLCFNVFYNQIKVGGVWFCKECLEKCHKRLQWW